MTIRIGTSGWNYNDWRGVFYPPKLPQSRWLTHYVKHVDTVEINNTFYQPPIGSAASLARAATNRHRFRLSCRIVVRLGTNPLEAARRLL